MLFDVPLCHFTAPIIFFWLWSCWSSLVSFSFLLYVRAVGAMASASLSILFLVVCRNCSVAWAVIHHGCDTMAVMNWSQSYTHFGPFSIKWDGPTLEIALSTSLSSNAFPSNESTIESTAITSKERLLRKNTLFMGISHGIHSGSQHSLRST